MSIIIKEVTKESLSEYSKIPMIKVVDSIYQLHEINKGLGGIKFEEIKVDYHTIDLGKEENPLSWIKDFDISNWGFFIAYENERAIGSMTLVYNTPNVNMLSNRKDLTVIWDIRVAPDYKYQGIGTQLFDYAVKWAKKRGCKQLKIETQNNNVYACKFYAKQGCILGEINKYAYYGEYDDEVMLIWYKNID